MNLTHTRWKKPGPTLQGARPLDRLDSAKVQASYIVCNPAAAHRLFYTAAGPDKPYRDCQGYLLLSVACGDRPLFYTEPGVRVASRPEFPHAYILKPTDIPDRTVVICRHTHTRLLS